MLTKIQAAQKCVDSGIQTLIVNGRDSSVFEALSKGKCTGTLFRANKSLAKARDNWLRHTLSVKGNIEVDLGASNAILTQGASLLASGIISVTGQFSPGEAVNISFQNKPIAKGLVQYSASDLTAIQGLNSQKIAMSLGYAIADAAVHRDDLVLL
jgi:glutamate 5-kinase